jgi:transposase-like protein
MEAKMAKMAKWRRHTVEFKRQVVERMKTCENIGALARELDLERKLLYTWKYQFEGRPEPRRANLAKNPEERKEKPLGEEITKLKLALAEKTLENDFFRSALLRIKEGRRASIATGASASTTPSGRGRKSRAN